MRSIKTFTAILFAATLLIACGGKDKKTGDEKDGETKETLSDGGTTGKLEGAWEIMRAEGDMDDANVGTVYEFKGDKLIFGKDGFLNPGKTEVTDSTFTFQAEGNDFKFSYNYHFNGDTLVVTMKDGIGQVFHMVKK